MGFVLPTKISLGGPGYI